MQLFCYLGMCKIFSLYFITDRYEGRYRYHTCGRLKEIKMTGHDAKFAGVATPSKTLTSHPSPVRYSTVNEIYNDIVNALSGDSFIVPISAIMAAIHVLLVLVTVIVQQSKCCNTPIGGIILKNKIRNVALVFISRLNW